MPVALKEDRKYTCQDYLTWPEDERWELIVGEAYDTIPNPNKSKFTIYNFKFRTVPLEAFASNGACPA